MNDISLLGCDWISYFGLSETILIMWIANSINTLSSFIRYKKRRLHGKKLQSQWNWGLFGDVLGCFKSKFSPRAPRSPCANLGVANFWNFRHSAIPPRKTSPNNTSKLHWLQFFPGKSRLPGNWTIIALF